MTKTILTKN